MLLVANKADGVKLAQQTADFYGLGFGDPAAIPARRGKGKRNC